MLPLRVTGTEAAPVMREDTWLLRVALDHMHVLPLH